MNAISNIFRSPSVHIYFDRADAILKNESYIQSSTKEQKLHSPCYSHNDDIRGHIVIEPNNVVDWVYDSITIEYVGKIVVQKTNTSVVFASRRIELFPDGTLNAGDTLMERFHFERANLKYNDFKGNVFQIKYYLKCIIHRSGLRKNLSETRSFIVYNSQDKPLPMERTIEMGVDSCLILGVYLQNKNLGPRDSLIGGVEFKMNRLLINIMQLQILRREIFRPNCACSIDQIIETTILGTYVIMDGCPQEGDMIKFRLPLKKFYNLTSTVDSFQVSGPSFGLIDIRYYANIIIKDLEDRKFFKSVEIEIFNDYSPYKTAVIEAEG